MNGGELVLAFTSLILKYGVPAAISIIKDWDVDPESITLDDIKALHDRVPPPESYFNKPYVPGQGS